MRKISILLLTIIIILSLVSFSGCDKGHTHIDKDQLTLYEINIDMNTDDMTAAVTQKVNYFNNTGVSVNNLVFNLHPNAFNDKQENPPLVEKHLNNAYYNGLSYGGINILRIESGEDQLAYTINNQLLTVLIEELAPYDSYDFMMRYHIKLPQINHRFGVNENTINLANFYPQLAVYNNGFKQDIYYPIGDPFYSEIANYKVSIKVDNRYKVAATGSAVQETMNVKTQGITYEANKVRDFAIVLSNRFKVVGDTVDNVNINYYYYNDKHPEHSLSVACKAIEVFQNLIGEYPYDSFNVVETDFIYGGMEYPQLIMIASSLSGLNRDKVIVHETAHQWWYGLVGNDSIRAAWMDEGLTEFMTALFFKETDNEQAMKAMINDAYSAYLLFTDVRLTMDMSIDTSMNRALWEYNSEYEYITMVYAKGMLMFNSLYEIMGREEFLKAIRNYYHKYRYLNATEEQLIYEFNRASSKPVCKIFDAWLNGKVVLTSYR